MKLNDKFLDKLTESLENFSKYTDSHMKTIGQHPEIMRIFFAKTAKTIKQLRKELNNERNRV